MKTPLVALAALSAACLAGTPLPGDPADEAVGKLGEPRAAITLPDGVVALVFDRGDIWVRDGRVVRTDLLTEPAYAERLKADKARRERQEKARVADLEHRQAALRARAATDRRQAEVLEQVRSEVRFPVFPPRFFGSFVPVNFLDGAAGSLAVRFSEPRDHRRDARGNLTAAFLELSNISSASLPAGTILLSFHDETGATLHSVQVRLPSMRPASSSAKVVELLGDGAATPLGRGDKIDEIRVDFYSDESAKVPVDRPRWLRPEILPDGSPAGFR